MKKTLAILLSAVMMLGCSVVLLPQPASRPAAAIAAVSTKTSPNILRKRICIGVYSPCFGCPYDISIPFFCGADKDMADSFCQSVRSAVLAREYTPSGSSTVT